MSKIISFFKGLWQSNLFRWILGIFVVLFFIIFLIVRHNSAAKYQFITVTEGPINEVVSVTGNTTPTQSVNLGFNSSGTITDINSSVGMHVNKGTLLAELNTSDLSAQLKQAEANVDMETAKLDSLKAGASPQDIAVSQSAVDKSGQDLANLYASTKDISVDGYAKGTDAMQTQLGSMFSNSQITFPVNDSQSLISADSQAATTTLALSNWQMQISAVSSTSSNTDLDSFLQNGLNHLTVISNLLQTMTTLFNNNYANVSAATLATYKQDVSTAIAEVNLASKNLNTLSQNIASQKLVLVQMQASLDLKKAGSTTEDIEAQQANVENAQANVQSINAKFANSQIFAPISGVVTQFDAKVGQIATPGVTLVAIISDGNFEVDANVPETDIGKITVGDSVSMTLDAFPGESFPGNVFYIDPAETISDGVVDYKIKISFANKDARMKSGLTANIDVQTEHKDNVLTLPQYALLQTDAGNFVKILSGSTVTQVPVTLGINDQNGNVEITSGVTVGEQVINIGLK